MLNEDFFIDNITWNDLGMDDVFAKIDHSSSSVGSEYIKRALRTPLFDETVLKRRKSKILYLNDKDPVAKLDKIFRSLGRTKKISFLDHIFKLEEVKDQSNFIHIILIILLLISIALIFINPALGIIAFVVMIAINIITYFKMKAGIEAYFICLKYLVSMVICAKKIVGSKTIDCDAFSFEREDLKNSIRIFSGLKRGSWLITNSVSGSITDVIMDYVRMIFHVDLIKFNNMKNTAIKNKAQIRTLYDALGEIELSISVKKYLDEIEGYCEPEFYNHDKNVNNTLIVNDIYHPLLKKPVKNSLSTEKSVLLTGSNASGKSTFLKTLAINQILAQTIYVALANRYFTTFYKVMSSMALTDNISEGESYYVVEIKSLKRIFDSTGDVPVMCFIDEVLRGTNTIERIAASSRILAELSEKNTLIFAATHDIELTSLLKNDMVNYHFSEKIEDDNVVFDYLLKEGATDTSNAIKLLSSFDFDREIVAGAEQRAEEFRKSGSWL